MTDLSAEFKALANYRPTHKVRFVTAASLFDGHDAAINIMRRILQGMGAEVIHLGHNRSVDDVVTAALQEDVQGIAISSYQGGHVEYFKYMVDLLKSRGGEHIQVFGGGGGVIVPPEIRELQAYGVSRIYSPEDGQRMGLAGMIGEMVMRCDKDITGYAPKDAKAIQGHGEMNWRALAQLDHRAGERQGRCRPDEGRHGRGGRPAHPGAGHHGHGRRRQVVPHRRTDPPPAAGPGRFPAHRRHLDRPVPPQERRRAAGRPHPHERDRSVAPGPARLHAVAGHARLRQRNIGRPARRRHRVQGGRLRPGRGGDLRHRPGRRRHRAAGGHSHVRDDAGVRRRQPAREDRHAGLRGVRRDQQVRPQGLARCAARCGQAGAAQQGGLRQEARRDAGVRHHGRAFQRRRRHGPVPGAQAAPGAAGAQAEGRRASRRQRAPQHQPDARGAGGAHPLPGGDQRHRARLQEAGARAGPAGARDPAVARERPHAARGRRRARRREEHRAAAGRRARRPLRWGRPQAAGAVAADAEGVFRRRVRGEDPRQGNPHGTHHQVPLRHDHPQGQPAHSTKTTARSSSG